MRMIMGLNYGALFGLIGWWFTAFLGWRYPQNPLATHIFWALGATLWNLFIQSMILFMWVSLTRQVREQITTKATSPPPFLMNMLRMRNRLFPWITATIALLMLPIVSGMSIVAGGLGAAWTRNPIWHRWTGWGLSIFYTFLVFAEVQSGMRLVRNLAEAQQWLNQQP